MPQRYFIFEEDISQPFQLIGFVNKNKEKYFHKSGAQQIRMRSFKLYRSGKEMNILKPSEYDNYIRFKKHSGRDIRTNHNYKRLCI